MKAALGAMRVVAVYLALALAACSGEPIDVAGRKAHLEAVMAKESPVGSSRDAITQWAANRGLQLHDQMKKPTTLVAWVEEIPSQNWACDKWMINVEITLNEASRSTQQHAGAAGVCL